MYRNHLFGSMIVAHVCTISYGYYLCLIYQTHCPVYKTAYQFYSVCEASALSFYKMHTVFACLLIFYLYINMFMFVKGSLKKDNRTVNLQYSNII